jgi:hypothetical protein
VPRIARGSLASPRAATINPRHRREPALKWTTEASNQGSFFEIAFDRPRIPFGRNRDGVPHDEFARNLEVNGFAERGSGG